MAQKKYASLSTLQTFLDNLKTTFSAMSHKHTTADLTDYKVDTALSSTSNNPVANSTVDAEFDAVSQAMNALEQAIDGKANSSHNHNDIYYTETEIDQKISAVNTSITNITSGSTPVKEAEHATSSDTATNANHSATSDSATSATSATKATQDGNGKVIADTYETKSDAATKLTEAKSYTDTKVSGLASTATVDNKISAHNTATTAHNDIRDLISGLTTRLNTLANSDDTTLDQMSEVVDYIKNNKSLIDGITTSKVNVADIVNNLTTNVSNKPLSSAQGVAIKSLIDGLQEELNTKSEIGHTHDDLYYTESEIDTKVSEINASVANIISGATVVEKANHASTADNAVYAISAEKAVQDNSGNIITTTYETKADATSKLNEAKSYADGVKNDSLNNAGEAYDTLKELGDLIDDNTDAIDALEIVAAGKADKVHIHTISDVTDLQSTLDGKAANTEATQSSAGLLSAEDKIQLDYGGIPIVATSGDGAVYTATVDGINSFTVGMKLTIIPHTESTTTSPKLNVNNLGAKTIRMPVTYNTSLTSAGVVTGWLLANKPVTVQWNGTYWIAIDLPRPSAQYLYGTVPVSNGGTGATDATTALTNLGLTANATELNYCDGVTSNIQTQLNGKSANDHNHSGQNINPSAIELGGTSDTHGGYIDFHCSTNVSADDFTTRIIEEGPGVLRVGIKGDTTSYDLLHAKNVGNHALPLAGGTLTGAQVYFKNGLGRVLFDSGAMQLETINVAGDDTNKRTLFMQNSGANSIDSALRLVDKVDGTSTYYNILHTGNTSTLGVRRYTKIVDETVSITSTSADSAPTVLFGNATFNNCKGFRLMVYTPSENVTSSKVEVGKIALVTSSLKYTLVEPSSDAYGRFYSQIDIEPLCNSSGTAIGIYSAYNDFSGGGASSYMIPASELSTADGIVLQFTSSSLSTPFNVKVELWRID